MTRPVTLAVEPSGRRVSLICTWIQRTAPPGSRMRVSRASAVGDAAGPAAISARTRPTSSVWIIGQVVPQASSKVIGRPIRASNSGEHQNERVS